MEGGLKNKRRQEQRYQKKRQLQLLFPTMASATLYLPKLRCTPKILFPRFSDIRIRTVRVKSQAQTKVKASVLGLGLFHLLNFVEPASSLQLQLHEPSNALSLPTWAVHVSSVAEWLLYFLHHFISFSFTVITSHDDAFCFTHITLFIVCLFVCFVSKGL